MTTNEELRRLHEAATPGPWTQTWLIDRSHMGYANSAYIVAACNELPRLLDEIGEAHEQCSDYMKAVEDRDEDYNVILKIRREENERITRTCP